MLTLYHGSPEKVPEPKFELCRPHNDYGPGFYCTQDRGLACEWACFRAGFEGYCNEYRLDDAGLALCDLDEEPYGPLNWIALLLAHRTFDAHGDEAARSLFIAKYGVDLSGFDIVAGYRADDSYFGIARAFLAGTLTDKQVEAALRLGDLGRQIVVVSRRAFSRLEFVCASSVQSAEWNLRWTKRDEVARRAFRALRSESPWAEGKRIYELVG